MLSRLTPYRLKVKKEYIALSHLIALKTMFFISSYLQLPRQKKQMLLAEGPS
jgi:hypothetical protein